MPFELTDDVRIDDDPGGRVRALDHLTRPVLATTPAADALDEEGRGAARLPATTPQALAEQYLQEVAPVYGIDERMLPVTRARLAEPAEPPPGTSSSPTRRRSWTPRWCPTSRPTRDCRCGRAG